VKVLFAPRAIIVGDRVFEAGRCGGDLVATSLAARGASRAMDQGVIALCAIDRGLLVSSLLR
jgi:hypothetical protein